jgi:chaperonin cofactor prefoldin
LKSISAQLSAIAVLKAVTHDYADAAIALAGATASMVASGMASQVSKNLTTTKKKIDAVGESANKAGKDLEYFIRRLQEIQSGMTMSSRNLIADISKLYTVYREAKVARDDAYKAYIKENQSSKVQYNALKGFFLDNEKELKKLQDQWEKLHNKEIEALNAVQNASKNILTTIKAEVSANKEVVKSYKDIYQSFGKLQELQLKKAIMSPSKFKDLKADYLLRQMFGGDLTKNLLYQIEQYENYVNILLNEQKLNVQKLLTDVYDQLSSTGKNIGEKLVNSIINGADKSDFLLEMKNYIRTNMIKIAVFTESFQNKFAVVGTLLAKTLNEGMAYQMMDMSKIRSELNKLYDSAVAKAKVADIIINTAFGDIGQTVEETTEQIEESVEVVERTLTRFEELMEGFKNEVADVGGEIGSSFVDAISEGMNQGDFLQKMKSWIKKMLVQSVVYTESMKAEIEAIGQAITKGIREGFTETSLHEIRRDLSWVFNEANKTVSSLDDILDKTFGGYAIGTNNAMSGLHLVGEAGPELVQFRGGEQVLNANNTQKALSGIGGTTINQNVTFNNLQDTTAYAMMNQFKQYNRQMAINGVI